MANSSPLPLLLLASKTLARYSLLVNIHLPPVHSLSTFFPRFPLIHCLLKILTVLCVKVFRLTQHFCTQTYAQLSSLQKEDAKNNIVFSQCLGICVQSIPEQLSEEFSRTPALLILSRSIRCWHKCQALPVSFSSSILLSLSSHLFHFQSSINVISSCTCLHYDPPPQCSRGAQLFLFLSSLFHHSTPLVDYPA